MTPRPSAKRSKLQQFVTQGGIRVSRKAEPINSQEALRDIADQLDESLGCLLSSTYEYPGRYTRWDVGFVNPPIMFTGRQRKFTIEALNPRGEAMLPWFDKALRGNAAIASLETNANKIISGTIVEVTERFPEEKRSKQPSLFSIVRALVDFFKSPEDGHLGLYGAFGYDLTFQFEPCRMRMEREETQRDLILFVPDELVLVDHYTAVAERVRFDFELDGTTTEGKPRSGGKEKFVGSTSVPQARDHQPGEYADVVRKAQKAFKCGDLFEAVASQTFFEPCPANPSELFRRLQERNPAPFGFLMNLGQKEYLVGASPEMFVRVRDQRVETCPISGTIKRGLDPIGDAENIKELLNSKKEESELTMCTDVDRNDKSRICVPGSVRVIGRRQIEMYSRLIHTVDHVEGQLRPGYDALDAFLCHTWAVTVTGAPKAWAMQFLEDNERSPRHWYGGAVGAVCFDGSLNTGLTLRTIRIKNGTAEVRAGATLLYDSDPDSEEQETQLKASAFLDALRRPRDEKAAVPRSFAAPDAGQGRRVLIVDHQDSFVHTLANYTRQTGAEVATHRAGFPHSHFDDFKPHLVLLSPGPGKPSDFDVGGTVAACVQRNIPIFGVCLGLQGMVEHFGGELAILDYPMHGKPSKVTHTGARMFDGIPPEFDVGRYHSIYAIESKLPDTLEATAKTDDGIVMAVQHKTLPISAVQFHPESIMTPERFGLRLIANALAASASR